jgi:TRAP-type C4-dicarboxylate transport system permease small subunit
MPVFFAKVAGLQKKHLVAGISFASLLYWSWTVVYPVYHSALGGAIAEILWLPMLVALLAAPIGAVYMLRRSTLSP